MSEFDPESTVGRRALILQLLDQKFQVSVQELSATFKVSEVTIRNDLAQLEEKKLLIRARGGALKINKTIMDLKPEKTIKNQKLKEKIGKEAVKLIEKGDTIILDSGTTTTELSKHIEKKQNLTVITNALNIAAILAPKEGIEVIIPGGSLQTETMSLVGSVAQQGISNFFGDKLFLGAEGLDFIQGFSTPDLEEAALNRTMMNMVKKTILVIDSTKFRKRSLAVIGQLREIDILVTDDGISPIDKETIISTGVELRIAN